MPSLFFRLSSSRSFLVLHSFIPSSLLLYLPSHNVICTPASGCCVCSASVRLVGDTLHAFFSQYVRSIRLFQLEFHQISLLFPGSERCKTLQDSNHKQHNSIEFPLYLSILISQLNSSQFCDPVIFIIKSTTPLSTFWNAYTIILLTLELILCIHYKSTSIIWWNWEEANSISSCDLRNAGQQVLSLFHLL